MNTSSWIVASFFHLFQQITKQLFLSKLWIYYMHINMLCYTTLPQQQNCFVNFESLTTPLRAFVNENMFTEAHPHMQNSWVVFLVNNVTNTRYKVKIDESTTTSKFYNLFQYNFCKKKSLGRSREKNCTTVEKRLIGSTAAASLRSDNNKLVVQLKWFFGLMPHYFRCGRLSSVLSIFWQLLSFELILASEIWSFSHSKYAICK